MSTGSDQAGFWLCIWLIVNMAFVGIFDLAVVFRVVDSRTVSSYLQQWSRDFLLLPIAIGVLIGHLFFPSGESH